MSFRLPYDSDPGLHPVTLPKPLKKALVNIKPSLKLHYRYATAQLVLRKAVLGDARYGRKTKTLSPKSSIVNKMSKIFKKNIKKSKIFLEKYLLSHLLRYFFIA